MFLHVRVHIYVYRCGGQTSGVISELVSTFLFFQRQVDDLGPLLPLPCDVCAITPVSTLLEINLKALHRLPKHFTNGAALLAPGFYLFGFVHMLVIHGCIWMCACRYACMYGG